MNEQEHKLFVMLTSITLEMNKEALKAKFAEYDKAVADDRANEAACEACYNQELAENVYLANEECTRAGISKGERITSNDYAFLLSGAELRRLLANTQKRLVAAWLTDKQGYYTNRTTERKVKCFWELANLCVDSTPEPIRAQFHTCRYNVVWAEKLMDIFRKAVAA